MKPKRSRKLFCTVIARIIDASTGEEAGLLYRWNTGDLAIMWKDEKCDEVVYE